MQYEILGGLEQGIHYTAIAEKEETTNKSQEVESVEGEQSCQDS
jgi:hypothetical protein